MEKGRRKAAFFVLTFLRTALLPGYPLLHPVVSKLRGTHPAHRHHTFSGDRYDLGVILPQSTNTNAAGNDKFPQNKKN